MHGRGHVMANELATSLASHVEDLERRFGEIQSDVERFLSEATDLALGELARSYADDPVAEAALQDAQETLLSLVQRLEKLADETWVDELFQARCVLASLTIRPPTT